MKIGETQKSPGEAPTKPEGAVTRSLCGASAATITVAAFTADQRELVGIASIQDLSDLAPGLAYSTLDHRPYLRGIGRSTDNLFNTKGSDGVSERLVSAPGAPEVIDRLFGSTAPRTYGVELQYRFR